MITHKKWLRISYWIGALVDLKVSLLLFFPNILPSVNKFIYGNNHSQNLSSEITLKTLALMIFAWSLLLIWADRKPIERKGVLLLSIFPLLTGLIGIRLYYFLTGYYTSTTLPITFLIIALNIFFIFSYLINKKMTKTQETKLATAYIVAGVIIKQNGKYLLVQENDPGTQKHGLWNFPAGKVEFGDSIEKTATKEAKEESGFDVELIRKIYINQEDSNSPTKHAFEAKIIGGKLEWPKDEILNAQWFSWQEIQNMKNKLRNIWVIEAIKIIEK